MNIPKKKFNKFKNKMKRLFLIKVDFQDLNRADGRNYFCPDCATIEGLLSFYPKLI
ncbi:MAG TPA: hypothetical protein DCR40_19040 [Prolixibacteraceae bacterium]|nr:hypothetical protein [Prolixibacteraceae bacterium]